MKIIVSKQANFFFFLSNLAEWHYSCRKENNEKWIEKTGSLSEKEKDALVIFSNIFKKYSFHINSKGENKYLGKYFYQYQGKDAWIALEKNISKEEFELIKKTFKTFKLRFEKIWKEKEGHVGIDVIKKEIKKRKWKEIMMPMLESLFGKNKTEIHIIALLSPFKERGHTAAGGANIGDGFVTLEIPFLKEDTWEVDYSLGVLAHEIGHMLFEKHGQKMIDKIFESRYIKSHIAHIDFPVKTMMNELIIESFVPYGCLGQEYSNFRIASMFLGNMGRAYESLEDFKKGKNIFFSRIKYLLVLQVYPMAKHYIKHRKRIDEIFIKNIAKIIKENFHA